MNRRSFFSFLLGAVVVGPAAWLCRRRTDPPLSLSLDCSNPDELVEQMRRASAEMMEEQPPGAVPRGIEYWMNR